MTEKQRQIGKERKRSKDVRRSGRRGIPRGVIRRRNSGEEGIKIGHLEKGEERERRSEDRGNEKKRGE